MKTWPFDYILIATHNKNKLHQFQDLFQNEFSLTVQGLDSLPEVPEIVEDQQTFEGNAIKKAYTIAEQIKGPVIADDSGIVVPALDGEPGVYSARYAGEHATDQDNNVKLIEKIQSLPTEERAAKFVCVMALIVPETEPQVIRGECEGRVVTHPRGTNGFGYDPIFYLPTEQATMAELPAERKYQISHRAKATAGLIQLLRKTYRFE